MVKSVRTVTVVKTVENDTTVKPRQKYEVGEWLEVYSGPYEGHNFVVRDVRYNHDIGKYEYLYGTWHIETMVIRA